MNRQLADEAIAAAGAIDTGGATLSASKRRVRGILEESEAGLALKAHLFAIARAVLGPWAQYLDPNHCENRALVIGPGGFISTHKDSREGDLTCVHFLTGGGAGQPVNSVGTGNLTFRSGKMPPATARITAPPTSPSCAAAPSISPAATPPRARSRSN